MKLNDVLKLIDAGYTKEEIQAMEQPAADPAPNEQTAPAQPEDPPHYDDPAADPGQSVPTAQTPPQDPVLEALNRLTNMMIDRNINQTVIQPQTRTTEDALAEIIAPPKPKK